MTYSCKSVLFSQKSRRFAGKISENKAFDLTIDTMNLTSCFDLSQGTLMVTAEKEGQMNAALRLFSTMQYIKYKAKCLCYILQINA